MAIPFLAGRLRRVVDTVFGGNATTAASVAGLAPPAFHRLLTGTVSNPRMTTAISLAESFGLPVEYLMSGARTQINGGDPFGGLPEDFWLLQSYFAKKQRPLRLVLGEKLVPTQKRKKGLNQEILPFSDLSICPVDQQSPLSPVLGWLFESSPNPTVEQINLLRRYYELETETLKVAEKQIRNSGRRQERHSGDD